MIVGGGIIETQAKEIKMIHFLLALMLIVVTGISIITARKRQAQPFSALMQGGVRTAIKSAEVWIL